MNHRRVRLYGRTVALDAETELDLASVSEPPDVVVRRTSSAPAGGHEHDTGMVIDLRGDELVVYIPEHYGAAAQEHLLLDHAVPLGLTLHGDLVVHTAGLQRGSTGLLLAGPSGAGKSTLSTWLMQQGWRVLGDDAVRLERSETGAGLRMWPAYDGARLHEDSAELLGVAASGLPLVAEYASKRRAPLQGFEHRWSTADHLVVLAEGAVASLTQISVAESASILGAAAFTTRTTSAQAVQRLDAVIPFAEELTAHRLVYPRSSEGLRSAEALLHALVG